MAKLNRIIWAALVLASFALGILGHPWPALCLFVGSFIYWRL